jgi:hypothetical protein
VPQKAPEVVKKRVGQVAPRVAELAVAPVPVALKKNRNPPRVAEADASARSLRAQIQFHIISS